MVSMLNKTEFSLLHCLLTLLNFHSLIQARETCSESFLKRSFKNPFLQSVLSSRMVPGLMSWVSAWAVTEVLPELGLVPCLFSDAAFIPGQWSAFLLSFFCLLQIVCIRFLRGILRQDCLSALTSWGLSLTSAVCLLWGSSNSQCVPPPNSFRALPMSALSGMTEHTQDQDFRLPPFSVIFSLIFFFLCSCFFMWFLLGSVRVPVK